MNPTKPHVHVNVAMSADGKIDTVERGGAQISSAADFERVDRLRAEVDAVLVGGRTLIGQDPRLTVKGLALRTERRARGLPETPAKVGVVTTADVRTDSRFMTSGPARRLIYTTRKTRSEKLLELRDAGAEVFVMGDERVDLPSMLKSLADLGVRSILVEGGGTIIAEFLRQGLVEEMTIYLAPIILGGAGAPTPVDGPGFPLDQVPHLDLISVNRLDEEGGILIHYSFRK